MSKLEHLTELPKAGVAEKPLQMDVLALHKEGQHLNGPLRSTDRRKKEDEELTYRSAYRAHEHGLVKAADVVKETERQQEPVRQPVFKSTRSNELGRDTTVSGAEKTSASNVEEMPSRTVFAQPKEHQNNESARSETTSTKTRM